MMPRWTLSALAAVLTCAHLAAAQSTTTLQLREWLVVGQAGTQGDCMQEWRLGWNCDVMDDENSTPTEEVCLKPAADETVGNSQTCLDGNPRCDADGVENGACLFQVGMCFCVENEHREECGDPEEEDNTISKWCDGADHAADFHMKYYFGRPLNKVAWIGKGWCTAVGKEVGVEGKPTSLSIEGRSCDTTRGRPCPEGYECRNWKREAVHTLWKSLTVDRPFMGELGPLAASGCWSETGACAVPPCATTCEEDCGSCAEDTGYCASDNDCGDTGTCVATTQSCTSDAKCGGVTGSCSSGKCKTCCGSGFCSGVSSMFPQTCSHFC